MYSVFHRQLAAVVALGLSVAGVARAADAKPAMTDRLIVLNLPHPKGLSRELAKNPDQQRNSQYARNFQKPGAHEKLSAEGLTRWVKS